MFTLTIHWLRGAPTVHQYDADEITAATKTLLDFGHVIDFWHVKVNR